MVPTEKLIKEISEIVASGKGEGHSLSTLANDYAALCRETNQRLSQCCAMIEKSNEYQALQLAETEPNLMDTACALSFSGMAGWRDFCGNNALTVPERLDGKNVKTLNSLYSKGISANHPLYKEYRAAVTGRDDDKALHIIRTIARLNPSDANAKSEKDRLLNKLFQAKLSELKTALSSGDEIATVRLVDEIENLAPPAKLAQFKEYSDAMDVRWEYRRRLVFEELRAMANRLEEISALGTWQEVGDMIDKAERLQIEKSFVPTEEEQTLLSRMQKFHIEQREIASQEARFRQTLGMLGEHVERVEGRIANRSSITLRAVEADYLTLNKRWQDVERFGKQVPDEMQTRIRRKLWARKSASAGSTSISARSTWPSCHRPCSACAKARSRACCAIFC
jgi:molybdopterin converting factor small subunit